MKLTALVEAKVSPAIFARYLILFVDHDPAPDHTLGEVMGHGEFYIITDIPPISEEKFQKLFKLSFERVSLMDWVKVIKIDHTDWYKGLGTEENPFIYATSFVLTWKEFVGHMEYEYHPDDDDFDE